LFNKLDLEGIAEKKFHWEFGITPGEGDEYRWGRLKAAIFDQYFARKFRKSDPVVAVVDRAMIHISYM